VIGFPKGKNNFVTIYVYFDLDDWKTRYIFKAVSYGIFTLFKSNKFPFNPHDFGGNQTTYEGVLEKLEVISKWYKEKYNLG